jgi:hypothetical protein
MQPEENSLGYRGRHGAMPPVTKTVPKKPYLIERGMNNPYFGSHPEAGLLKVEQWSPKQAFTQ